MKDRQMVVTFDQTLNRWIGPEERLIMEECNQVDLKVDFRRKEEKEENYRGRKC